jgi:2-dehydro-3-deoxygluconokinase
VTTLRESFSATHNGWKALLYDGQEMYYSQYYDINPITDRIGAGDAFAAGLIHGLLSCMPLQTALDFGVAASALKHTIVGDFNLSSQQEILALMNGNTNGRVQR